MSPGPDRRHRKAFSVHDLPRDLVDDADSHMKALEITEWRKKLTAGILQMIRKGILPPEFLRLLCAEGAVAKEGGTLYTERRALIVELREALSTLCREGEMAARD